MARSLKTATSKTKPEVTVTSFCGEQTPNRLCLQLTQCTTERDGRPGIKDMFHSIIVNKEQAQQLRDTIDNWLQWQDDTAELIEEE